MPTAATSFPSRPTGLVAACAAFEGDVLIVQSGHDDIVPPQVITSYREACVRPSSLTYRRLDGADHGLTDEAGQRGYTALLTQWLGEMLPDARRHGGSAAATSAAGTSPRAPPPPQTASPRRRRSSEGAKALSSRGR